MTELIIATILAIATTAISIPVRAQNYYVQQSPFWNSYYAAQNGYNSAFANGMMVRQQRANEAMINAYRQVHALPPCSLSLIGQWQGRPAC